MYVCIYIRVTSSVRRRRGNVEDRVEGEDVAKVGKGFAWSSQKSVPQCTYYAKPIQRLLLRIDGLKKIKKGGDSQKSVPQCTYYVKPLQRLLLRIFFFGWNRRRRCKQILGPKVGPPKVIGFPADEGNKQDPGSQEADRVVCGPGRPRGGLAGGLGPSGNKKN